MDEANDRTAALIRQLFEPGATTYAVLDGARNERVHRLVAASGKTHRPLYDGELSPGMRQVSPYIVELEARHAFTRTLLDAGWGDSWGIFVVARMSLDVVRRHLRRFLRVTDERGKQLLFRYYDPRVLRIYLPTCTTAELETFFGPLVRFVAEDADQQVALTFERTLTGLGVKRTPLPAPPLTTADEEAAEAAAALAQALADLPSS
jgi:hypothetical protein